MSAVRLLTQAKCKYCCMLQSQVLRKYQISHTYWQSRKKSTKTHYEILQVSKTATANEIKDAFFKLSKETHPDTGSGKHGDFVLVNEAYTVLKNPTTKKVYDDRTFGLPGSSMGGGHVDPEAFHKARKQYYESTHRKGYKENYRQYSHFREPGNASMNTDGFFSYLMAVCTLIAFSKLFFFVLSNQSRRRDTYAEMHDQFNQYQLRGNNNMLYRDDRMHYPYANNGPIRDNRSVNYTPVSDQDKPKKRKKKKKVPTATLR